MSIKSKGLHDGFVKWGVVPRKTHILTFPDFLESDLYKHFIRGYIDGDGCIHKTQKAVSLSGTKEFCIGVRDYMKNTLDIHCSVMKAGKNKSTHKAVISGRFQVKRFLDWLYENADMYLIRKHETYLTMYCNNES